MSKPYIPSVIKVNINNKIYVSNHLTADKYGKPWVDVKRSMMRQMRCLCLISDALPTHQCRM